VSPPVASNLELVQGHRFRVTHLDERLPGTRTKGLPGDGRINTRKAYFEDPLVDAHGECIAVEDADDDSCKLGARGTGRARQDRVQAS
jgi:hypothetical protein